MVIGIIGAGASGMAAAIAASENASAQVLLFERQARVGRKLQATGNGRCNLTNLHACAESYHGEESSFVRHALDKIGVDKTLKWFQDLGLYVTAEPSGRVYPYSDQANSVVDVLRFALQKSNIQLLTGFEVTKVRKAENGFLVEGAGQKHFCDRLIIACGGLAGTKLGGSISGYQILKGFGHRITKLRPALVQIKSDWSGCAALKGVRANCHAAIYHDGCLHSQSEGELQFTEQGLSGPVIFEVSRDVCQGAGCWVCRLDLLPDIPEGELLLELKRRKNSQLGAEELLTGILHNRLGRVITAAAGIRLTQRIADLSDESLQEVCKVAKSLEVQLTEPLGMDAAQVTAGGALTAQFDPVTMQSLLVPCLYACGEVLDIDGDCGGYNLQWAWSSGILAGANAAEVAL
ncbi:MAG: aminoacetone oxidase family FAD-binding enzyme [Ruminococcaceae bacterium]|nr:aminoacetone oxidase family FAD-binding enzyme [Oscillospiraceae bacterium]